LPIKKKPEEYKKVMKKRKENFCKLSRVDFWLCFFSALDSLEKLLEQKLPVEGHENKKKLLLTGKKRGNPPSQHFTVVYCRAINNSERLAASF